VGAHREMLAAAAVLLLATSCVGGADQPTDGSGGVDGVTQPRDRVMQAWVDDPASRPAEIQDADLVLDLTGEPGDVPRVSAPEGSTLAVSLACDEDVSYEITILDAATDEDIGWTAGGTCDGAREDTTLYSFPVEGSADGGERDVELRVEADSAYRLLVFQEIAAASDGGG
jgi:hypothetical protein